MGRDNSIFITHRPARDLHRSGLLAKFVGGGVLVDATAQPHERFGEARQVRAWVNACLIRESDARPVDEWHLLEIFGVKSELTSEGCVVLETFSFLNAVVLQWRVQVSIDPLKAGVDPVLAY